MTSIFISQNVAKSKLLSSLPEFLRSKGIDPDSKLEFQFAPEGLRVKGEPLPQKSEKQ